MNGLNMLFTLVAICIMAGVWVLQSRVSTQVAEQLETVVTANRDAMMLEQERHADTLSVETAEAGTLTIVKEAGARTPRSEIVALLNTGHFSSERRLTLSQIIYPPDLRREGETIPDDPELRDLWIKVRARALSTALCEDVVRDFADACRPINETLEGPSSSGHYVLNSALSYRPATDFGVLPDTETVSFASFDVEPEDVEVNNAMPGAMRAQHARLYALVKEACAEIRAVHGNCGPLKISARLDLDRGGRFNFRCNEPRDVENACRLPRFDSERFWLPRTAGDIELRVELGYLQPPVDVAEAAQGE